MELWVIRGVFSQTYETQHCPRSQLLCGCQADCWYFSSWGNIVRSREVILSSTLIKYSNLFKFTQSIASTFKGAILTVASHRHNVLAISTCITYDITSPSLLTCIQCAIFWKDAFKMLPGLFLGGLIFVFIYGQGKCFTYHRMLWYPERRRRRLCESAKTEKAASYKRAIFFKLSCCEKTKSLRCKQLSEQQRSHRRHRLTPGTQLQHQPQACKHSDSDFSDFASTALVFSHSTIILSSRLYGDFLVAINQLGG